MQGYVTGGPKLALRIEGLLVLVTAIIAFARLDAGWWLFFSLFLVPDLSMAGYLLGRRIGSAAYNLGHCYALPLGFVCLGLLSSVTWALTAGIIWSAHIGFDRALGFGLKYADAFGATHLGQIGGAASSK